MIYSFHTFKHWLQTRIYYAWLNFQEERNKEKMLEFKSVGKNVRINSNSSFSGMENMEIGDNFYSGNGVWMEAITEYHGQHFHPNLKIGNNFSMQHKDRKSVV